MSEPTYNQPTNEVASVGELGTSIRGDRIYHNAKVYHKDLGSIETILADMKEQAVGQDHSPKINRMVFRGIVSPQTMQDIFATSMAEHVEVGMSLQDYGEPGWLVGIAINSSERQSISPRSEMIATTSQYAPPADFRAGNLPPGATHSNQISPDLVEDLHELWLPFDWSADGVAQRAQKVDSNLQLDGRRRDTWFSGISLCGRLACAATAERLVYQGENGDFDLIESTEWSTHPDFRRPGQSFTSHNLRLLNQEIMNDMGTNDNKIPLIFAEANYMTRADKAGRRAGFVIPPRERIGQMVIQNVAVNDGLEPVGRWRDFTFLVVPPNAGEAR